MDKNKPKTEIILIGAISKNDAVGQTNGHKGMPWPNMKTDQKFFKDITMGEDDVGHPMVMGRNTFLSFGNKPLPGRHHIVLSHNTNCTIGDQVTWLPSVEEIIAHSEANKTGKLFVLGGPKTWNGFYFNADTILMTYFNKSYFEADVFYSKFSRESLSMASSPWKIESEVKKIDEVNRTELSFVTWKRRW